MSSNQHAGPGPSGPPPPPEPPFAERARTLMHRGRVGTLSTQLRKHPGFPFGSVSPYGLDGLGRPTLLISTMAVHTHNLLGDPHASLLVTQPGWNEDPLAGARLTLVGTVGRVPEADRAAVREEYLARHENARFWVDFDDFAFYRLDVAALYYVAGFGAMGWVEADDYRTAAPDPLADHEAGILEHMNADHADALLLYCRAFAGVEAEAATMTGIDRLGFRVRARAGDRLQGVRINFPRQATTPAEARAVLVEMVRDARARAGGAAQRSSQS
jgi:putative heme iron utilization protein